MTLKSIKTKAVAQVFEGYPTPLRTRALALRSLILETAASTEGVGEIEETLKWGEPAYLTSKSKSGSTIRIGVKPDDQTYALHFICHTKLVEKFRHWFPTELHFDGNRSILIRLGEEPSQDALATCIAAALTYHRDKTSK